LAEIKKRYDTGESRNKFERLKKIIVKRPIVLFGAGVLDMRFYDFFRKEGIPIECYCDNNKTGIHTPTKLQIITVQQLKKQYSGANIVITPFKYRNEISNQLKEIGFLKEQIFTEFNFLIEMMEINKAEEYFDGWEWVYNFLNDNTSKQIVVNRIKSYLFGDSIPSSTYPKYFENDIVKFSNNEVFVDAGMTSGDITKIFIHQTNGAYRHIFGFEPDEENYKKAENNLSAYPNVTIIQKALWSNNVKCYFNARGDGGSHIVNEIPFNAGKTAITTISIDNFFGDKLEKPVFIKLSTEGAEKEIIHGAKKTIENSNPQLAVSAYHHPSDLYELIKIIHHINPCYNFFLRHYSEYVYDTIIYTRSL
jgi:FkbM family methyltransferase